MFPSTLAHCLISAKHWQRATEHQSERITARRREYRLLFVDRRPIRFCRGRGRAVRSCPRSRTLVLAKRLPRARPPSRETRRPTATRRYSKKKKVLRIECVCVCVCVFCVRLSLYVGGAGGKSEKAKRASIRFLFLAFLSLGEVREQQQQQ